jgi:cell division protein FtsL
LEKYIKIIIIVLIVGFLSLSMQLWYQARAINELREDVETMKVKVEAVRELLFRIGSA